MGVLDGVTSIEGEAAVLGVNLGHPIVTKGDILSQLCESNALFSNYFGGVVLFSSFSHFFCFWFCMLPVSAC